MRGKIAKALRNMTRDEDGTVNKSDYRKVKKLWKKIPRPERNWFK